MARSIETITTQVLEKIASFTALAGLSSQSTNAVFYLLINKVIAPAVYLYDQIIDANKATLEAKLLNPTNSTGWLKEKILAFQYGYVPTVSSDGLVKYDTIDETAKIITSCTIVPMYDLTAYGIYGHPKYNPDDSFKIGISKGSPPVQLSAEELAAATAYIGELNVFGASYSVSTYNSDLLYLVGTVYYDGNDTNIKDDVFAAINSYVNNLPADGVFYIYDLSDAIKQVDNVKNVFIKEVAIRKDADAFADRATIYRHDFSTPLAVGSLGANYKTTTGALIEETDSGNTWADKITFTPA